MEVYGLYRINIVMKDKEVNVLQLIVHGLENL